MSPISLIMHARLRGSCDSGLILWWFPQSHCSIFYALLIAQISVCYLQRYFKTTSDQVSGNARLAGFEKDLGLEGYDYNTVLSIFYISYIFFEIPATVCCKVIGPGWFLPATTLGFGVCSICTAFVHTRAQACAVRFVLGIFEAGVMPGCAYYLSRYVYLS